MAESISPIILYVLMLFMLITGTLNTVFLKLQNLQYNRDKDTNERIFFNHAFFQTF